ncbi:Uncharacterized protein At4g14450, chloroplastic [Linum grandiflorum]
MADKQKNASSKISSSSITAGQSSRLQRRKPASLQINPATSSFWNAAIPLLSPLETSPMAIDWKEQQQQHQNQQRDVREADKPIMFKKWQHPAAPFCYDYEPEKLKPSFFVPEKLQCLTKLSHQFVSPLTKLSHKKT